MKQKLKQKYVEKIHTFMESNGPYKNKNEYPKLIKIVINCGVGEAAQNSKFLDATIKDLSVIAGQQVVVTRAKKAIAGFKIREGMPVGVFVTLRGEAMYAFLDRLIHLALPRIRDFQGLNIHSFDQQGNFHIGLQEQLMFPEINYDKIEKVHGMNICFVLKSKKREEAIKTLTILGIPFAKQI
uniref:Large ribosomal subunit protein uL5c n=1 Tax=Entransia fimbriata TaxID=130991 RepID=A0A191T4T7_9VIRI|nr:ribosomal protein L5 [Entransia fimbriata]ANI25404.1 ribosomal protein L5 [Entransia fimbriata]WKT05769.1 ribosomal protein L5 [Entransia fimbriata]WKT05888.1 ribosomal protein L5 [Entransia fimbriata]